MKNSRIGCCASPKSWYNGDVAAHRRWDATSILREKRSVREGTAENVAAHRRWDAENVAAHR